jgi:SAM-dependent methyltransferase
MNYRALVPMTLEEGSSRAHSDYDAAARRQWTDDPCGSNLAEGEPGTAAYFERLVAARHSYAPWMAEVLDYAGARGLRVLDVGCGQGIDLAQYAAAGSLATGIDLTPRHVELARRHLAARGLYGEVLEGDAEGMPFAEGSFDRVSSNGVLHHTSRMAAALNEIWRVLRPGGEVRIIVYNRNSLHYWVEQVLAQGILKGKLLAERSMAGVLSSGVEYSRFGGRPLVRVYTRKQLHRLLEEAGFADVTTAVRHFHPDDTFVTRGAAPYIRGLRDPAVLERIGRAYGWYIVAWGARPSGG